MPNEPHQFSRAAQELIGSFRKIPDETPRKMRIRPTKDMGGLVQDLLVKYKIGIESEESVIREHWAEVAGPANAHYSHVRDLDQRGCLTVLASHAVVRNELFLHRKMLLQKIQKLPGCAKVKALTIRAG
ncbi:hypothetical protein M2103_000463 [Ereboglobus sp. PH5-5]|uniref:DciA family protein n=1 Tax=Ereboglobus sp. PH5-5 TaxID=2940529 RepID=UPI0024063672|nr:DciA family protein [Ereboglobus sp. PH5-5]MDF9832253.1 hypothetical protein [Ereboglobus sp. PH5-5]